MSTALISTGSNKSKQDTEDDLKRDIGSVMSSNQLSNRIKALTNPQAYANDIKTEQKKAEGAAINQYKAIYENYWKAGLPHEQAKVLAQQAARNAFEQYMDTVRLQYPETATGLYMLGAKMNANQAAGNVPFSAMSAGEILNIKN